MTFKDLSSLSIAIRAKQISYDYFSRVVEMTVVPEYGVETQVKDKVFQLRFEDCAYYGAMNTNGVATDNGIEFIVWGQRESQEDRKTLLKDICNQSGPAYRSEAQLRFLDPYGDYFFENAFGDVLRIISARVVVREISSI